MKALIHSDRARAFFGVLIGAACCIGFGACAPQATVERAPQKPITQNDIDVADARLRVFVDKGYDPLTTPPEWYTPVRTIDGGTSAVMPRAKTPPTPAMQAAIDQAADYFEEQISLAFLVAKDGEILTEKYWGDFDRDSRFNPQSMSKTVAALAIGIAIEDGILGSVDDRIDRYLPELANDARGAITLKDLLQMSGGLEQISTSYEITPENRAVRQHFGPDFIAPMMELTLTDPPGTKWDYNNNETLLLSHVLTRASGQDYASFISQNIWQPLNLASADMYLDRDGGTVMTSCCILSRPIDWLKIGQLILNQGEYGGTQIVPAQWIEQMITPAQTFSGYGYQIWLGNRLVSVQKPETGDPNLSWSDEPYASDDLIVLSGYGFQRVWIVPSKNLVIMRAGNVWPKTWNENYVPNMLIRAAK